MTYHVLAVVLSENEKLNSNSSSSWDSNPTTSCHEEDGENVQWEQIEKRKPWELKSNEEDMGYQKQLDDHDHDPGL